MPRVILFRISKEYRAIIQEKDEELTRANATLFTLREKVEYLERFVSGIMYTSYNTIKLYAIRYMYLMLCAFINYCYHRRAGHATASWERGDWYDWQAEKDGTNMIRSWFYREWCECAVSADHFAAHTGWNSAPKERFALLYFILLIFYCAWPAIIYNILLHILHLD